MLRLSDSNQSVTRLPLNCSLKMAGLIQFIFKSCISKPEPCLYFLTSIPRLNSLCLTLVTFSGRIRRFWWLWSSEYSRRDEWIQSKDRNGILAVNPEVQEKSKGEMLSSIRPIGSLSRLNLSI